jgi:hypothetical protein
MELPSKTRPGRAAPAVQRREPLSNAAAAAAAAVEAGAAVPYPRVLPKTAFAPLPRAPGRRGDAAAPSVDGPNTAASPARFVFVVGLEGSGHHLMASLFGACGREIDALPLPLPPPPPPLPARPAPPPPRRRGGLANGNGTAAAPPTPRRHFCHNPAPLALWSGRHDAGLMGAWPWPARAARAASHAPAPAAPTAAAPRTANTPAEAAATWASETIVAHLPRAVQALARAAAAPEAAYR